MKDIIKIMRFDFVTSKAALLGFWLAVLGVWISVVLLFAPFLSPMFALFTLTLFLPAQNLIERDGGRRIYGILPVQRSSITRAAFLEIAVSALFGELLAFVLAWVSVHVKLYGLFLSADSAMNVTAKAFSQPAMYVILFVLSVLLLSVLRMCSDIFGRKYETRITLIMVTALSLLITYLLKGMSEGTIPSLGDMLPASTSGKRIVAAVIELAALGICAVLSEITVKKLADREM